MTEHTFIFIGRSGCGKGTQAALLRQYIEKIQTEIKPVLHIGTGERFREFIQGTSYTSRRTQELYKRGARMPDFLAIWNWGHLFVDLLQGNEHIILDGAPRSLNEAINLDTAFKFYERAKPTIIYLNVSKEWSKKHLLARNRSDDNESEIENRLSWFETEVMPAVEYYRKNSDYSFFEITGEQPIEKVHQDITHDIEALFR